MNIGFDKLSNKQYSTVKLYFEGSPLIDKKSTETNLGLA